MEAILSELFTVAEQPKKSFPNLMKANPDSKEKLQAWLNRLSDTADYKKGGEAKIAFANKILTYLSLANDQEAYRDLFF